jgi:Tfp pilus assembly protein PilN
VKRFNYAQPPLERLLGDMPMHALTDRLRVPLVIVGAALFMVASTWSVEANRVAGLDTELAALQLQVEAAGAARMRAEGLIATVSKLRAMRAGVAAAQREAIAATNTIARIGNGLPAQTWLTTLGATPAGAWTIGGRSTRVSEIGTMLRRVQNIDRSSTARLVSVAATGRTGHVLDFVIGWDRRP